MLTAAPQVMSEFATRIYKNKYAHTTSEGNKETWEQTAGRVVSSVVAPYLPHLEAPITRAVEQRKLMPGGRYLSAAGRRYPQINNCFLFRAHDSREGWGKLTNDCVNSLMTGGGIGVVYSDLRKEGELVKGMGGASTGPCALMRIINESGRYIMQGGSRRSAIWAGLHWRHGDVFKFIVMKDWNETIHRCRREDFSFPAPMDGTNISVILDDEFFAAYHDKANPNYEQACNVYWTCIRHMLRTGEPGFSVDTGENDGENLRNACTEVTSRDNGDSCNLLSVNMSRVSSIEEFNDLCDLGTAFLLCGSLYGKLPVPEMYPVREKNRRIGLGLMGVHDWLVRRGYRYEANDELAKWMGAYRMSGSFAARWADKLSISRPVATRSIAPTGTISIVAETTSGLEPLFAAAYKRRYLDGQTWKMQYVVDETARTLVSQGVDPGLLEDAFTLSEDVGRRLEFQAWMQSHVDHGISSTINLPAWGSSVNNESTVTQFGNMLLKYLPKLRGITAYPNGCRGGQPLNRVDYHEAVRLMGTEYTENAEDVVDPSCKGGFCNS